MKIQKGHYVPKELITSEAVHEAVVKAFVAAGFNKIGRCNYGVDIGAGGLGFSIRVAGGIIENPLTLQQLFTAENGLSWPDWASEIQSSGDCIWFSGAIGQAVSVDLSDVLAKNNSPIKCKEFIAGREDAPIRLVKTLATRQPKEKEVKTIEDAVIELGGVWPEAKFNKEKNMRLYCKDNGEWITGCPELIHATIKQICYKYDFELEAKRLGYINGYRWGVEYPTNGKRPELADDVEVQVYKKPTDETMTGIVAHWNWCRMSSFKITDPRYKPAETSYLNASTQGQSLTHSEGSPKVEHKFLLGDMPFAGALTVEPEPQDNSWHERGELPPVGMICEYSLNGGISWFICEIRYVVGDIGVVMHASHLSQEQYCSIFGTSSGLAKTVFRPIRTEREKFSDDAEAAFKATGFDKLTDWGFLYDAGFRGPKVEKSQ